MGDIDDVLGTWRGPLMTAAHETEPPRPDGRTGRNPDWAWDEIVLCCELVVQNGWHGLPVEDQRVIELSKLLHDLPLHSSDDRLPDFRNPNGVTRKSYDLATAHPDYSGKPTHGSITDKKVIAEFIGNPNEMHSQAEALFAAAVRGELSALSTPAEEESEDIAATEGRLLIRRHIARERDLRLRKRKIAAARKRGLAIACEVCGFDFERAYGERGRDYIDCHHIVPLHVTGVRTTRIDDLAMLCANCHRMIHVRPPWLTPAELKKLINEKAP